MTVVYKVSQDLTPVPLPELSLYHLPLSPATWPFLCSLKRASEGVFSGYSHDHSLLVRLYLSSVSAHQKGLQHPLYSSRLSCHSSLVTLSISIRALSH